MNLRLIINWLVIGSIGIMNNCHQKEEIQCSSLKHIKQFEGSVVYLEGVLTKPAGKIFPSTINLEDGTTVAFIFLAEKENELNKQIKNLTGRKIRARGVIRSKNFPEDLESRLNIPYLLDVDYIGAID